MDWATATLEAGRREVAGLFTAREWNFLHAVLQGTVLEPSLMPHIASEVAEAIKYLREDSEMPVDIDGASVEHRLRSLGGAGRWAVCDVLLHYRALETPRRDGRMRTWIECGVVPGEGI